ncbi:hypothetical protein N7513_004291 [Penicillium frequentans]|nr:hypothetical protein N7513_004291 [Penicillium glabrum]
MAIFSEYSEQADAYHQYREMDTYDGLEPKFLGAAIAYEASKIYDDHCAQNGAPTDDSQAKAILIVISNGLLDREIDTKGLQWIDSDRVRYEIKRQCFEGLAALT